LQQQQLVRTWPAADRGGVFSAVEPTRCGTSWEDDAGDVFGLLARRRRLVRGGMQQVDFVPRRWSGGLIQVPRGGALHPTSLTTIPEMRLECGVVQRGWRSRRTREACRVAGWRSPRTREMSNDGSGEAPARWVASDSVFFTLSVSRLGCNNTAAVGLARR
jgi:hypothetical protein